MNYPHNEKIKKVLEGCAPMVVEQGLNYLIPGWQQTAEKDVDDQSLMWEEYVNELDGRDLIERILDILDKSELELAQADVARVDDLFKQKTHEVKENLWGSENELRHNWNRNKNWYYYRAPEWMIDETNLHKLN